VIEFFDYQCIYCSKLTGTGESNESQPGCSLYFQRVANSSRWENSEKAAQRGLDVWKQKGAAGYMAYQGSSQKTESMVTPVFATPILTISWLA
jgi:hypothetical protein